MGKKNRETIGLLYQLSDRINHDRRNFSIAANVHSDRENIKYDTFTDLVYSHQVVGEIEKIIALAEQNENR